MINKYFSSIKQDKLFSNEINSSSLSTREEIQEKYKWNLIDIYSSDDEWEEEFNWIENNYQEYSKFENKLGESSTILFDGLTFDEEIGKRLEKLFLYAMLAKDSDLRINKYQSMDDKVKYLYAKVSAASAFIRPELLSIPEEKINQSAVRDVPFLNEKEELKIYKHFFEDLFRVKSHTLSKEEEKILALSSEISSVPYDAFSIFTDADLKFPTVKDQNGNDIEISHGRYYAALYSKDRDYREGVFKGYYKSFIDYANTFSTLLNGGLKANIFSARARKYNSAREAALDRNNIPISAYDILLNTVNENFLPMHRWAEMKRQFLKLDKVHPFDTYVSLFELNEEKKYSFEEGKQIVMDALKPLGNDYLNSLNKSFNERWIDVFETKGKRSGAYSSGTTYGVHPYVLLNWTNTLNDVFTLAHELGHNMHSYYTGNNQPYIYCNYTIFVAEVASTFNELLLLDYFIKNSSSNDEKLFFIEKYLNNITATFYRQTMFAEFEMNIYSRLEKGEALTAEDYRKMYKDVYSKYWGDAMNVDEEEEYTWSRVPHFYYNFYVYQYATGFAASQALVNNVINEGESAINRYLNFLKSGSSDYSINLLKNAGVDMTKPEPILYVIKKMEELVKEAGRSRK